MDDSPVYRIQSLENPRAPCRVLHRNMLHPACSVQEEDYQIVEREVPTALSKANALMEAYFQD